MSLLTELSVLVGSAFAAVGVDASLGSVVVSQRPDLAQFQCNGAMAGAKQVGKPPRDLAIEVAEQIKSDPRISAVEVAGPGFLNIHVTDELLAQWMTSTAGDQHLGLHQASDPMMVIVDYGGPNVAKDLHVGHLRPHVIGESLKRVYRAAGHDAKGDIHLGDFGLPMGQLIAAIAESNPELPYFDEAATGPFPKESPVTVEDLQVLYPQASGRSKAEPEFQAKAQQATVELQAGREGYVALWEHFRSVTLESLRAIYARLGVNFDLWLGEASTGDRLEPLVELLQERGVAVESEGAIVIHVTTDDDKKALPPLMLRNSRGGSTYATTDLATIQERVEEFQATAIVYIVDLRQSLHFEQVFRAARLGGIAEDSVQLIHAGNGTVNGPDGKPFKTRDGGLPRLSGLLDETVALARTRLDENELALELPTDERDEVIRLVGMAALKYGELSNHRTTNYSFDIERFTQLQGKTGPYLQYVAVRAKSILGRAAEQGLEPGTFVPPSNDKERALILSLLAWPEVVERTLETLSPNVIAEYTYELATAFNQFYDACHIMREQDPAVQASWLGLVSVSRLVLVRALDLLTIEVPDRM